MGWRANNTVSSVARPFWLMLGGFALVLGAVGVVLPVLPTTPFVILAAFAFSKSSARFHLWLTRNKIFGPIIEDWNANGAIAPKYKIIALCMMAGALLLSVLLNVRMTILAVQLGAMSLAALYILTRPSGK